MNRPGRALTVVVLIGAIVASIFARNLALSQRRKTTSAAAPTAGQAASLSGMDSYALALLLGGLRGPLVMFLWPSSEMQKSERNLQDFDTKIEWIRLLQAEFDTVHIFQIWNKAYNISVQMANVGNKYTTILDAVEYAHNVSRERPNNINMLAAIAGIYFDKFGNSAEKNYYKEKVREQTLPHAVRERPAAEQGALRRPLEHPAMLDAEGRILPEYLRKGGVQLSVAYATEREREQDRTPQTYDGSELQFLPQFEPYPDGLSPFALAYNYHKRAQLLQQAGSQRHAQLSEMVIDSRPALALRNWAEDEWRFGRRAEMQAAGVPIPADELEFENPTAAVLRPDTVFTPEQIPLVQKAIRAYDKMVLIAPAGDAEYLRHTIVNNYTVNVMLYQEHRDILRSEATLAAADRDYLKALLETDPAARRALLQQAAAGYRKAMEEYTLMILRYQMPGELVESLFPAGVTKQEVEQIPADQRELIGAALVKMAMEGRLPEQAESIADNVRPHLRASTRLDMIEAFLGS